MAGNLIQITDAGRAALVAAGNTGTVARRVVEIGIGTAAFAFDKGMTALPNERKRVTTFGGENVAPDTVHVVIQDDSDDQYSMYAYGLYLDNGVLFGIYVQSTPILEKSPAAMLLLASDIVFASIDAAQLQFGPATFLNPPATIERKGVIELATQAEVDDGADDTRAVTPKTAAKRYAPLAGPTFTGDVWIDRGNVNCYYVLNGTSGTYRSVVWKTGRVTRWEMGIDNGVEAGANAGSHWYLSRSGDDGKWIDNILWISRTTGVANFSKRPTVDGKAVWDAGNFSPDNYLPIAGGIMTGDLAIVSGKRLFVGTTTDDQSAAAFQVTGGIAVNRASGEGRLLVGQNDGYFYGNANGAGFWSPSGGAFDYLFASKTLRVNGSPVWTAATVDPLDKSKGGTIAGDLAFAPGKRVVLAEGSLTSPSLTFANDGASDTGLYHTADGLFGVTCNGASVLRFTPTLAAFDQAVTGPTPPAGDRSTRLATTEWVLAAISTTAIGQIVFEPRTTVRAGFVKANGAVVNRSDYPALWAYAQASGALVSDDEWQKGRWGCFSTGDGAATFRLPEMRGEFIRCWSDGRNDLDPQRSIGSFQADQNRSHAHSASASEVGDHGHNAWSDGAGFHGHDVADPGHVHNTPSQYYSNIPGNQVGASGAPNTAVIYGTLSAFTGIGINGNGHHAHNIGVVAAGRHSHAISINADGGNEARPRNVALLAMIRAY
ncbi:hypothetical protein WI76_09080 [Burkholderia ubonensis]|uniref:phage tail protein n=1 Tax=Burkholderia ubonensis TaxID=101571 RepID=UPI00075D6775|nr:phage tail protein [Burkholderia ubonensis]KVC82460.1 hypothetical protein WI76_09080 [Burkholderia ubonensis]